MDFRVPELGEGVYEAELVSWLVKPGDAVKRGQPLMEVLTDKATMEVPSPFVGVITGLQAEPGQQLQVGQPVLTYSTGDGAPDGGENGRPGDRETGRPGDRENVAPAATAEGSTSRGGEAQPVTLSPGHLVTLSRAPGPASAVKASPSVRFMARKLGLDLARVPGSGPGGRVLIEDLARQVQAEKPPAGEPAQAEDRPDYGTPGSRIKLAGLRRKIAEHMVRSKRTIPHYSYVDECDVTDLVRLRDLLREPYARAGVRLTYLAFFVKAAAAALKEVPIVNASLDEEAVEIVLHDRYHIGVAVATPAGLIVPVVRDADRKDLASVAGDIDRLSTEARSGKTRLEDLRGGTFTVTSIGGIGGLISTPVINHPEVAILGVGKVVKRPVYDAAGNVRPADLVYLSLSFDHRVVDGAVGAVFGNAIIRHLQAPAGLLPPPQVG